MPNLDELKAQYERLGQEIKKLEGEEWPNVNDRYWSLDAIGNLFNVCWDDMKDVDYPYRDYLGIYRTQAEAEAKLAVVKATMSPTKRWVPEDDQCYWFVQSTGDVSEEEWCGSDEDYLRLATNNVHRTENEAEAYARLLTEYGESIVK